MLDNDNQDARADGDKYEGKVVPLILKQANKKAIHHPAMGGL
jgi:hypothetical protein